MLCASTWVFLSGPRPVSGCFVPGGSVKFHVFVCVFLDCPECPVSARVACGPLVLGVFVFCPGVAWCSRRPFLPVPTCLPSVVHRFYMCPCVLALDLGVPVCRIYTRRFCASLRAPCLQQRWMAMTFLRRLTDIKASHQHHSPVDIHRQTSTIERRHLKILCHYVPCNIPVRLLDIS